MDYPVVKRHAGNPILTRREVPYPVATVHNAGVVKHRDKYIMLFRSHCLNGRSIIGLAYSSDGFAFQVRDEPFLVPAKKGWFAEYEEFGVEDVRICPLNGEYLLTYSAYSARRHITVHRRNGISRHEPGQQEIQQQNYEQGYGVISDTFSQAGFCSFLPNALLPSHSPS